MNKLAQDISKRVNEKLAGLTREYDPDKSFYQNASDQGTDITGLFGAGLGGILGGVGGFDAGDLLSKRKIPAALLGAGLGALGGGYIGSHLGDVKNFVSNTVPDTIAEKANLTPGTVAGRSTGRSILGGLAGAGSGGIRGAMIGGPKYAPVNALVGGLLGATSTPIIGGIDDLLGALPAAYKKPKEE